MSPTLLEGAVAIILIVVAWQIGLAIAPSVLRGLREIKRDIDEVAELATDEGTPEDSYQRKEEYSNDTRRTHERR